MVCVMYVANPLAVPLAFLTWLIGLPVPPIQSVLLSFPPRAQNTGASTDLVEKDPFRDALSA